MGKIAAALARMEGKKVYFDTNIIAYIFSGANDFLPRSVPFFEALAEERFVGITGEMALAELLVKPIVDGDEMGTEKIKNFFDEAGLLTLVPHLRDDFELSARIRALQKLKSVDALHAATAINRGCQFLITGDKKLAERAKGLETIDLNEL